jgi:hypothetical protein
MPRAVENAPQDNVPRRTAVVCPSCRARLRAEPGSTTRTVKCPDCSAAVRIPAAGELGRRKSRPEPAEDDASDLPDLAGEEFGAPDRVRVKCPKCGVGLFAPVKEQPRHMPCPKCSADVPVPGRKDVARALQPPPIVVKKKQKRATRKRKSSQTGLVDALAAVRTEEIPEPPRWPFVWGVFTFPWHPDVFLRWVFLSAGFAAAGLLLTGVLWCLTVGGPMLRAAYAFSFPMFWVSIWTLSYAAACSLVVVEQTANGNQEMGEWPEPQWTGWLLEMTHVLIPAIVAALIAWGVGLVLRLTTGWFWSPLAGTLFVLFPIFWMSSLECDALFLPFSRPILWSLVRLWWAWLLFYAEAALLLLLGPGLLLYGVQPDPFGAALGTAPVLAAVILIYSRLLGRLAWRVTLAD